MSILTANQIRQQFIDFFVNKHGHTFAPSSSVVPHNDPTLLFSNAGMNQFKDVFLGTGERGYTRAVNTQKCIRAGGKHNDLEDVGKDSYHHTFFEMLGNWSFGDYFKEEAIRWAWELLTEVWGLDKNRLYATVFAGDDTDGTVVDTEAEQLWKDVTDIDSSHISRWGKKDNFWEMGETGPCGPCSEIHYDSTPDFTGGYLVNQDDERVIEIWNLVFIQYNRGNEGKLTPLPAKHVDTGMGFERVVRIIQNKSSNYDVDLWTPLFMAIEQKSGAPAYGGRLNDPTDIAYRVIADHARCLTFAINDGAMPGNEGRGYVLRRILRRAVRHVRQTLGVSGPFIHKMVLPVVESMAGAFPELQTDPDRVIEIIREEEESFSRTLDRGLVLFKDAAYRAISKESNQISAKDAFKLHDTYGFPIDLTQVMAAERGLSVDFVGYQKKMEQAREIARAGGTAKLQGKAGTSLELTGEHIARLKFLHVEPTEDLDKFHGHAISARIKAIWNGKDFDEHTPPHSANDIIGIITNRTNFYAEMGGQIGDTGRMYLDGHGEFNIIDTQIYGGYVLHIGRIVTGKLNVGDRVELEIDHNYRMPIMRNHTGTHLLNLALRATLGDHIQQKGSSVAPDKMRFDFSHNYAVNLEQIIEVTNAVAANIKANLSVYAEDMPLIETKAIHGLRAVFGEKYPDPVRVVSIGKTIPELRMNPDNSQWMDYSIELCGGTHVPSTSEIIAFAITHEEAVGKGVRRLIAVTGSTAIEADAIAKQLQSKVMRLTEVEDQQLVRELPELVADIDDAVVPLDAKINMRAIIKELQDKVKKIKKQAEKLDANSVVEQARNLANEHDGNIIVAHIQNANADTLRSAMDVIREKHPESAMLLLAGDEDAGKVAILAWVSPALIKQGLKAGDWVREVAQVCGGNGGGRPDMAQAGGKDPAKINEATDKAKKFAYSIIG